MAEVTLTAETGRPTGSGAARRLRHAGRVPGVVYGHGMQPLSVSVNARELRHVLTAHGLNRPLTLDVAGDRHLVLARQLQRHPVRHTLSHVDFQVVRRDEVVLVNVPVVTTGDAVGVSRAGGLLEHPLTSLSVRATAEHIPTEISVDVSALNVGEAIRVGDIKLPRGVTTEVDPDEVVVLAAASTVAAEVTEAEEAAAGTAEGAEAGAGEPAAEAGANGSES